MDQEGMGGGGEGWGWVGKYAVWVVWAGKASPWPDTTPSFSWISSPRGTGGGGWEMGEAPSMEGMENHLSASPPLPLSLSRYTMFLIRSHNSSPCMGQWVGYRLLNRIRHKYIENKAKQ